MASYPAVYGRITMASGSVIDFTGSAIVNAANEGGVSGGGVDGAINKRGGRALVEARRAMPKVPGTDIRIPTGGANTTTAGDLDVDWVIHAVGPNYSCVDDDDMGDLLLFSAYIEAMRQARAKGARTVGFSLLSAGIFRGGRSLAAVLRLGLLAVEAAVYPELHEAVFVGFTRREEETLGKLGRTLLEGPESGAARHAALEGLCAPIGALHQQAVAEREPPIGYEIAMQAAIAGNGPP